MPTIGFTRNEIIKNFWCALWCSNATTLMNKGIQRFDEVFNSCRPHHKKGNLIRGFLFCFVVDSRANMQIIAGSREKYGIHRPGFFTKSVPFFAALPQRTDSRRLHEILMPKLRLYPCWGSFDVSTVFPYTVIRIP